AVLSISSGAVTHATAPATQALKVLAPPTVGAVAQQGQKLTGSNGTWSGSGSIQYAYQWYRCDPAGAHCKSIHGATRPTYTQVAKDVGQTIGFAVHATDSGTTVTAYASLVGPVAVANSSLVATGAPALSGTAAPGQTIQTSTGSWNQTPTGYGYQW